MTSEENRETLRRTFGTVAASYQEARPEYPAELFRDLLAVTGLPAGDRVLEVGCATGKATLPLARRGFRITCVELGADLARVARVNLAGSGAEVIERAFEDWRPPADVRFGLVFAATAWHWIDPAQRYRRAWEALRPDGYLSFWSAEHVTPDDGDPFFWELQEVYDEIGEGLPTGTCFPRPGELRDYEPEITASGLFDVVHVRHSIGSAGTTRSSTSPCWTRSLGTSPWPIGSASDSTARSGPVWPNARTGHSGVTGARCCTSHAGGTRLPTEG